MRFVARLWALMPRFGSAVSARKDEPMPKHKKPTGKKTKKQKPY